MKNDVAHLTYMPVWEYIEVMARAATTSDIFNAIAEPRRRDIVDTLAGGPREVGDLAQFLHLSQPAVSKHLAVLREVGAVSVVRRGRSRIYSLNPRELKTVHDWSKAFERLWTHQAQSIKERAERKAAERSAIQKPRPQEK